MTRACVRWDAPSAGLLRGLVRQDSPDPAPPIPTLEESDVAFGERLEQRAPFGGQPVVAPGGTGGRWAGITLDQPEAFEAIRRAVDAVLIRAQAAIAGRLDQAAELQGIGRAIVEDEQHPEAQQPLLVVRLPGQ